MKKIMILGAGRGQIPLMELCHKYGAYVIAVSPKGDYPGFKICDEPFFEDIKNKESVLAKAKELSIDAILTDQLDQSVPTVAYVAEKMGLPFQCTYEAACILQDKSKFRKFLADNGFNCPKARGYNNAEEAIKDVDYFNWPVIVKPVDSAGSKGVTKVEKKENLEVAIETALAASISKNIVIEDFLDKVGAQSSADVFTVNGKLVYATYSDQLFDENAANPYTPAIEIWPSSMDQRFQDDLTVQLQRLVTLLDMKTGIYNVESRVCSNGRAYIMEVSPRGGGNRIAELQDLATGQSLIQNEIKKALNMDIDNITTPIFNGVWCNYIVHSSQDGILESISIDEDFKAKYVKNIGLTAKQGDAIHPFTGANTSLGTLFLKFDTRVDFAQALENQNWLNIQVRK